MLFNGSLEPIFIEISFDEKKKIIAGLLFIGIPICRLMIFVIIL